jgi:hypothetical protein
MITSDGTSSSAIVTSDGAVEGGGGTASPAPLFFGGQLSSTADVMRSNGVSNEGTFATHDTGSEHALESAATNFKVKISRTNTTSDCTFRLAVNGVLTGDSMVVSSGNNEQAFTPTGITGSEDDLISVEYTATTGSAPDFCTAAVWYS